MVKPVTHPKWGKLEMPVYVTVKYTSLEDWRHRRQDRKTEAYWDRQAEDHPLSPYEEYQREWNFREVEYPETPSNNGLGLGNPGFAFTTNLTKYIRIKECTIKKTSYYNCILYNTIRYIDRND